MVRAFAIAAGAALALATPAGCSDDTSPTPDGSGAADARLDHGPLDDGGQRDGPSLDGADSGGDAASVDGAGPATNPCPALPPPTGKVVTVTPAQAKQLPSIVAGAKTGTTIQLAKGTYKMSGSEGQRRLTFSVPGVTLRSASGVAKDVVIDGEYVTKEMVFIRADDITIADLTLRRAVDHPVHVTGGSKTIVNTRLHNLRIIDGGEQFVKVNSDGKGHYADEGRLECSQLLMTAAGRKHVEPSPGGCYTGGIDVHGGWGWKVRFNRFEGIHCDNGSLAEHAIHFWSASRGTLVERNTIVDCARGVGFGLGQTGKDRTYPDNPYPSVGYMGHIDGIIRNNVIHAGGAAAKYFDTGIELNQAHGALVYHNTVASKPTFSSIDYRFPNTKATIRNNLTHKITVRNGAKGTVDHNLQGTPASYFVNPGAVDYRLKAGAVKAVDKGVKLAQGGLDMSGTPHDHGPPDLGAHERRP